MEPLLKVGDVARQLNVSVSSVYRLARCGELKSIRIGALVRIKPEWVEEYQQRNTRGQAK